MDHESNYWGEVLLSVSILETILGTITILLRTYVKFGITRSGQWWSYYWAVYAWAIGVFQCVAISLSVHYGLGMHITNLSDDAIVQASKWSWITNVLSRASIIGGRNAFVAFMFEIQPKSLRPWRKILLWTIAVSNTILNLFLLFWIFFRCIPPAALWNKSIPGGRCPYEHQNLLIAYTFNSWGALSDFTLACYPATFILKLQMPRRRKVGITMLMSMGVLACVCAAMTVYNLRVVDKTSDPTYDLTPLTMWSVTELWVILMAGSAAPIWPLVKRIRRLTHRSESTTTDRRHFANPELQDSSSDLTRRDISTVTVTRDVDISVHPKQVKDEKSHDVSVVA